MRGYFIPGCNGTGAWSHKYKYIYIYRCDCCIQKSCVGSALPPLSFPASFFGRGHLKPSHSRSKVSFRRLWETWGPKLSRDLSVDELESFWAPCLILFQRLHTYISNKNKKRHTINKTKMRSLLGSETLVRLDSVWFSGSWFSALGPEPFPVPRSRVSDPGPHPGPGPGPVLAWVLANPWVWVPPKK